MYHSKKIIDGVTPTANNKRLNAKGCTLNTKPAFSLVETLAALAILALISSSVLVVIGRCMSSTADLTLRMRAFRVARDNMETLLASDSVQEMVDYGTSDEYPEIQWQTTVETFYEPITARMWIRATCSAEYTDIEGVLQTVELTHWLTDLTKQQLIQMMEEKQREKERLAEQVVETIEDAAEHAGVDVETVEKWVENGMLKTEDGRYVKKWLELYKESNGQPSAEAQQQLAEDTKPLLEGEKQKPGEPDTKPPKSQQEYNDDDVICGHTIRELKQMSFDELEKALADCDEF